MSLNGKIKLNEFPTQFCQIMECRFKQGFIICMHFAKYVSCLLYDKNLRCCSSRKTPIQFRKRVQAKSFLQIKELVLTKNTAQVFEMC